MDVTTRPHAPARIARLFLVLLLAFSTLLAGGLPVDAQEDAPHFNVEPATSFVAGSGWLAGAPVTVTVGDVADPVETASGHVDDGGWLRVTVDAELPPGTLVTVSDGETAKNHVVVRLELDVDPATAVAAGEAEPGTAVTVSLLEWLDGPGGPSTVHEEDVVADAEGVWSVDLAASGFELTERHMVFATVIDDDGDGTLRVWSLELEPDPVVGICPSDDPEEYDSSFVDVDGGSHWVNIVCMADRGLTRGTGDGTTYSPRQEVTRGQMASFIVGLLEDYTDGEMATGDPERFDDVPGSDAEYVHATSIHKLAAAEIVSGTAASGGDQYAPQRPVNRMQMGTFIRHALSWLHDGDARNESFPPAATRDWFPDPGAAAHEHNVNAIAEAGIVRGFADGTYGPTRPVMRDQMASFVMHAYDYGLKERPIAVGLYKIWRDVGGEVISEAPGASFTLTLSVDGEVLATLDQDSEMPWAWAELARGTTYEVAEADLADGWETVDCGELDREITGTGDHSGVGTFELTGGGRHFVCNQATAGGPSSP